MCAKITTLYYISIISFVGKKIHGPFSIAHSYVRLLEGKIGLVL